VKNVIVYREADRYSGWPANYGIWGWGDEIVLGFVSGHPDSSGGFHARDRTRPFTTMQARSLDGGEHWQVGAIPARTPGGRALSADEHVVDELRAEHALDGPDGPKPCDRAFDFTHPDFALMCARTNLHAGTRTWFYASEDRCRSWQGPYSLPMFGQPGVAGRTDYVVLVSQRCLLFLTATQETEEGSHVFCAETTDGGRSFEFVSWVSPQPETGHSIMPASALTADGRLLVATRERRGTGREARNWIDLFASDDEGRSWKPAGRPVPDTGGGGNPPTLTRLADGRLCLTYGCRKPPFGMRARVSDDGGSTWGDEIVLRDDAGSHDIGYPRSIQRADGSMVTAYYYTDDAGGACYIAATIWSP